MVLRKTVATEIQEYSDYKKQHEFFSVKPAIGYVPRFDGKRLDAWLDMCRVTNLKVKGSFLTGGRAVVLVFENGLQITDTGSHVSFSAVENKEKVDMNSAMTVIRCSANHLCRHGWDLGVDFSSVRFGSAQMVMVFEESYKKARQMMNAEKIEFLKRQHS